MSPEDPYWRTDIISEVFLDLAIEGHTIILLSFIVLISSMVVFVRKGEGVMATVS